jgi:hypothetical protein
LDKLDDFKIYLLPGFVVGMREAIDQFVGTCVAQFAANQALQVGIVRLEPLRAPGEGAVLGYQAVSSRLQLGPMISQQGKVPGSERRDKTTGYQQGQGDPED